MRFFEIIFGEYWMLDHKFVQVIRKILCKDQLVVKFVSLRFSYYYQKNLKRPILLASLTYCFMIMHWMFDCSKLVLVREAQQSHSTAKLFL